MPELPAKERSGKSSWLGPVALGLGLLSWLLPVGGEVVAIVAVGCGTASIVTRRAFRIDWTAATGICVAAAQLFLALVLFAMRLSGL